MALLIFHPHSMFKISRSLTILDRMLSVTKEKGTTQNQYASPTSSKFGA